MDADIIGIFFLAVLSFVFAVLITPLWSGFLYRYKMGKSIRDAASAPVMAALHAKKAGTPTMGGVIIWATTLILAVVFAVLAFFWDGAFKSLSFLSRRETWLPLFTLVAAAIIGLVDDYWNVRRIGPRGGGLRMRHRLILYTLVAAVGAWWFYFKLGWNFVHVPFVGDIAIGWLFIPFFILVVVATSFSVNETDGLDGLAGGTLASSFAAFGAIAIAGGKYDIAGFCAVVCGATLAFLWFNVNPARFFMGDTGAMSLGVTLAVIAFLLNQELLLLVIGFVFVVESLSVIIQLCSKKFRKKKIFLSTPLHHHFEAQGWPEQKVVMRAWIISAAAAVLGLAIALLDKTF
jgi:phospho-N-acetylmuramoyl-pentapeptide-transferase